MSVPKVCASPPCLKVVFYSHQIRVLSTILILVLWFSVLLHRANGRKPKSKVESTIIKESTSLSHILATQRPLPFHSLTPHSRNVGESPSSCKRKMAVFTVVLNLNYIHLETPTQDFLMEQSRRQAACGCQLDTRSQKNTRVSLLSEVRVLSRSTIGRRPDCSVDLCRLARA